MDDTKQIIEVNGVKLEVDLRTARRIEELQVGSRVKVLLKSDYSEPEVASGIIVGFEPFPDLPTIIVAYVKSEYNAVGLKTIHYNAKSKNVQIVASIDDDFSVSKKEVLGWFDREEKKARDTLAEIDAKREFFLDRFKSYWRDEPLSEALKQDGVEA
jgi:hypothetical protein